MLMSVLSTSTASSLTNNGRIYTAAQWAITNNGTLDTLIAAGKLRYAGVSNYPGWQLMKAQAAADRLPPGNAPLQLAGLIWGLSRLR